MFHGHGLRRQRFLRDRAKNHQAKEKRSAWALLAVTRQNFSTQIAPFFRCGFPFVFLTRFITALIVCCGEVPRW